MSWNRSRFQKVQKTYRHTRVSFQAHRCSECRRELRTTHLLLQFGGLCRLCWSRSSGGSVEMASR